MLALSLLLNAAAIGAALRLHKLRQTLTGGDDSLTLPPQIRADLRDALANAPDLKTDLARLQAARQAAVAAATATPFDRAQTEAALTALRGDVATLMEHGQQVVLDTLSARAAP